MRTAAAPPNVKRLAGEELRQELRERLALIKQKILRRRLEGKKQ